MSPVSKGVRRTGSAEALIQRDIAQAILDRRMPPGTKLPESRLGQLYDVSRTVVRKALFRLSDDRLIDLRPNCGASVARPSVKEAREVWAARALIEPALLEQSLPRMEAENRRRLRALLAADRAAHESGDRRQIIRASGNFHLGLARMAENAVLYRFLEQLIGRTSLVIAMYSARVADACPQAAHENLAVLIVQGKVAAAKEAMLCHLRDCEEHLDLSTAPRSADLGRMLGRAEPPN